MILRLFLPLFFISIIHFLNAQTVPVFEDGEAQVVEGFANKSQWIRETVFVETEFDSDGDGKLDRMHVSVTRQGQTETEGLKVPVIYATSPYYSGTSGTLDNFWKIKHEIGAVPPPRIEILRVVRALEHELC